MKLRLVPLQLSLKKCARASYSTSTRQLTPNHSVYVSRSTNPYFNLSLEDWLFRNKNHQEPLLLLYRDDPSVVIGRNQNPWKEVNLQLAAAGGVPFIRRRSGGGTVYHDLGNTNYSIHLPRSSFDRNATAKVVVRALRSMGIDAEVNERNDICFESFKMSSAYKIVNNRAYHHGTMLISTKLDALGGLLHTSKETMVTKGVASVRSPVRNLQEFNPTITHENFVDSVISSFRVEYDIYDEAEYVEENEDSLNIPYIQDGMKELQSWNWQYGQTPEFTYTVAQVFEWGEAKLVVTSKHGIVLSCEIECDSVDPVTLATIDQKVKGLRYGFIGDFVGGLRSPRVRELWEWIRRETSS